MRLERRERRDISDNLHCGVAQPDPTNNRRMPAVKFFIFWR